MGDLLSVRLGKLTGQGWSAAVPSLPFLPAKSWELANISWPEAQPSVSCPLPITDMCSATARECMCRISIVLSWGVLIFEYCHILH
jgi:hypothetical protein